MNSYDAVLIGAGPNALVNAAYLSRAGWKVLLVDKHDRPGGGLRTEELTLPGFVHDVYAGFLILFGASAANAELGAELAERGLELLHTTKPAGVSMPGGRAAVLTTSMEENLAEAERLHPGDSAGWLNMVQSIGPNAESIFGLLAMELGSPPAQAMIRDLMVADDGGPTPFAQNFLTSARVFLESSFKSEVFRGLLAPWVFHTGHGPEEVNSGFWDQVFAIGCQMAGQFVAKGGAEMMAKALVRLIEDNGGEFKNNTTVTRIVVENGKAVGVETDAGETIRASRAVITSTNPDQLYNGLLPDEASVPDNVRQAAGRYRYGHSVFVIHLAMDESPRWVDSRLDDVIYTHITSGLNGVSRNFNETTRHLLPADPVVGVGTPTLLDPSRAPEGKAVVVLQVLDVPYEFTGDAAGQIDVGDGTWNDAVTDQFVERVLGIVGQHVTNIPSAILAKKVLTPKDLEAANPNWVHGDPYSGSHDLSQSYLMRPFAGRTGHGSPVESLYTIGASTHPGLGLGSNSGFIVAKQLLQNDS